MAQPFLKVVYMDKVKGILIKISDSIQTEQIILNGLYDKLVSHHFDYIEHPVLASKTLEYISVIFSSNPSDEANIESHEDSFKGS